MTNNDRYIINEYLEGKDLKHSKKGYMYLMEALLCMDDKKFFDWKMIEIYDEIADKYKTKSANVERSIRSCIKDHNTSNKEFIARAVHDIYFKLPIRNDDEKVINLNVYQ